MEDKVVLDRKSFEALAAGTRVKILKSLKQRRKTLSELSKELDMSISGTKEHLQNLEDAELVVKIDDGHKWKYYELTKKGKGIIGPKELKVWILLSISSMAFIVSVMALLAALGAPAAMEQTAAVDVEEPQAGAGEVRSDDAELEYAAEEPMMVMTAESAPPPEEEEKQEPVVAEPPDSLMLNVEIPLLVGVISLVTVVACGAILLRNRRR